MKYYELDPEEQEILDAYDKGKFESIPPQKKEQVIKRFSQAIKNTMNKKNNVNLRVRYKDISVIKARAARKGVPYQTLLSTLIHQYAEGDIRLQL
jgi:predicted DNA binding CopG/RHH family protein